MQLVTNSVAPNKVTETDSAYIIKDVPFVRSQELSGGFVPEWSIEQTANEWVGKKATLNHPRDNQGKPVPAESKEDTHIGEIEDSWFDGEYARANIRLEKAELQSAEAKDIQRALENGEQINVSSQYIPRQLPSGEYEGRYRDNVEAIAQPDSVAILPNKRGKCDPSQGCGINPQMAANADVRVPMTRANNHGEEPSSNADFSEGDLVEWEFGQGVGQGRVEEVVSEAGEEISVDGGKRIAKEDDPAVLLSSWEGDGFDSEDTVKLMSNLSEWSNPPDEAMSANAEVPDKYSFDNPGEAMSMAQDMGLDAIHTHGSGDDTVFMPGQSHEALVEMLEEDMMSNAMDMALTDVGPEDIDSYTDSEWNGPDAIAGMPNPSESDENADILDQAHLVHPTSEDARDDKSNWKLPFRDGPDAPVNTRALVAAKAALEGARGGVEGIPEPDKEGALERIEDFLTDASNDLFGSMAMDDAVKHMDMEDNVVSNVLTTVAGLLGMDSDGDEPAESGADVTTNQDDTMEREELIDEITSNSKLTEAALAERCDDGLEAIHSDVMDNDTMSDNSDEVAELKDRIDELESKLTANEQENKEQIAETIVANSNEYEDTEDVLDDYPTEAALEAKQDSLNVGGSMPGMGTTANTDFSTDDEFDVGSGVLTE
jgi:hypothetical protein